MNFRTTIVLLILLIGVIGYVMFTGGGPAADTTAQKTNPSRLLDMQSNDVNKVVLTSADGKSIVLERSTQTNTTPSISAATSDWKLISPIAAYADTMKVSDLIDGIVSATSTSQVDISGSNVADYGLDAPQYTVDLEAGPKSAKVDIGRQVKAGNELYVRVEGRNVAEVIAADVLDKLDTTAEKLRLAQLIKADAMTANWISITRPADSLTLEKSGGQWQMTVASSHPTTLPVEQSVVSDLVAAASSAQAVEFGDDSSNADVLIGHPQATVTISDQRPSTQPSQSETLEFGVPDSLLAKNVWVRVTPPGTLATIAKETMDSILKSPLDLRSRDVARLVSSSVTQIRIVKNKAATTQPLPLPATMHMVVLTRRPPPKVNLTQGPTLGAAHSTTGPTTAAAPPPPPTEWQITSTREPSDADDSKVDAVLASFNPLHADKFLAAVPATPAAITYTVTLTTDKGQQVDATITDPGESSTEEPTCTCADAIFSLPRTAVTPLDADFAKVP